MTGTYRPLDDHGVVSRTGASADVRGAMVCVHILPRSLATVVHAHTHVALFWWPHRSPTGKVRCSFGSNERDHWEGSEPDPSSGSAAVGAQPPSGGSDPAKVGTGRWNGLEPRTWSSVVGIWCFVPMAACRHYRPMILRDRWLIAPGCIYRRSVPMCRALSPCWWSHSDPTATGPFGAGEPYGRAIPNPPPGWIQVVRGRPRAILFREDLTWMMGGCGRDYPPWCAECDAACGLLVITLRYGSVWSCSFGSGGLCCLSRSVPAGWGLNCGPRHVSAETAIGVIMRSHASFGSTSPHRT